MKLYIIQKTTNRPSYMDHNGPMRVGEPFKKIYLNKIQIIFFYIMLNDTIKKYDICILK